MKKVIILVLLLSALVLAQERSYIEFIPMVNWEAAKVHKNAGPFSFDFNIGAHIMLNQSIAIKPFVEYTNRIWRPTGIFGILDFSEYRWKLGMGLRYYFGKDGK